MAMNPQELGQELCKAATSADPAKPLEIWTSLAEKIITHLQTYGVVNVSVQTTGSASAQAGVGTGKIS